MSEAENHFNKATERAADWVEGVGRGILNSIVPIMFVSFAIGATFMIINLPLKQLGGI